MTHCVVLRLVNPFSWIVFTHFKMECQSCLLEKECVEIPCKDTNLCAECWYTVSTYPPECALVKCPLCMVPMKDWRIIHGKHIHVIKPSKH